MPGCAHSSGTSASGGTCVEVCYCLRAQLRLISSVICIKVSLSHTLLTQCPQKKAGWVVTAHPQAHLDGAPCLPRGAVLGWPCLFLLTERSWSRCAAL